MKKRRDRAIQQAKEGEFQHNIAKIIDRYNERTKTAKLEVLLQKLIVKPEVAEAIEAYMKMITTVLKRDEETGKGIFVAEHCQQDWRNYEAGQYSALNLISTYQLMQCLTVGYVVEEKE